MERVFSMDEIDKHWSQAGEEAGMNRSSSVWELQQFLQEAFSTPDQDQTTTIQSSTHQNEDVMEITIQSSSSSTHQNEDVVEIKGCSRHHIIPNANAKTDSEEYKAYLKTNLQLACAAAVLIREGNQVSNVATLENGSQPSNVADKDLIILQDMEVGGGSGLSPLPAISGVQVESTTSVDGGGGGPVAISTSGSSEEQSDVAEGEKKRKRYTTEYFSCQGFRVSGPISSNQWHSGGVSQGHLVEFDVRRERHDEHVPDVALLAPRSKPYRGNEDSRRNGSGAQSEEQVEAVHGGGVARASIPAWSSLRITEAVPACGAGAQGPRIA